MTEIKQINKDVTNIIEGAVTIHKKFSGFHVDIWVRSFNN